MSVPLPICYLNGHYLPFEEARISPFDRGFLYGDGAYELMPVYGGRPFRLEAHCSRLSRSLEGIRMEDPHTRGEWRALFKALIERNGGGHQYIYWQVTRGAERGRNHAPLPQVTRTVFAFCAPLPLPTPAMLAAGLPCITAVDTRWARCDIKSVSLIANVLLRQQALDAEATETILLREGHLTDASASAVHVVIAGELHAPPLSHEILPGTTRGVVEELAERLRIPHRARAVSEAQLRGAQEIWLSGAARGIMPVTRLDGAPVGGGVPGPLWRRIHDEFARYQAELADQPW